MSDEIMIYEFSLVKFLLFSPVLGNLSWCRFHTPGIKMTCTLNDLKMNDTVS